MPAVGLGIVADHQAAFWLHVRVWAGSENAACISYFQFRDSMNLCRFSGFVEGAKEYAKQFSMGLDSP